MFLWPSSSVYQWTAGCDLQIAPLWTLGFEPHLSPYWKSLICLKNTLQSHHRLSSSIRTFSSCFLMSDVHFLKSWRTCVERRLSQIQNWSLICWAVADFLNLVCLDYAVIIWADETFFCGWLLFLLSSFWLWLCSFSWRHCFDLDEVHLIWSLISVSQVWIWLWGSRHLSWLWCHSEFDSSHI